MKAWTTWLVALLGSAASAQAPAAASLPDPAAAACPHASEVRQAHLLGLWRAEVEGLGHAGTLLLEKHPEYTESVRGFINRDGDRRPVAGDVDDGEFTLEESADGLRITATWLGEMVEGSCGREIRGTWGVQGDGEEPARSFVLRKQ